MSPVWILKRLVSVFIKLMLVAYRRLCHHCRNLAEGGCLLSRFHFTRCRYFLGHVACRNLPWQGLIYFLMIKTPLLLHIKPSQTNTQSILIVLSFHYPLKKKRRKEKQVLESYITVSIKENFNLNYEKFL